MIYGRGKWLYGALVLAAREAARHFVREKSSRGGNGSWRPLTLRWRRRRKTREYVSTSHTLAGARVSWFPQFHFHFATQPPDRRRQDGVVKFAPKPEVFAERVVVDRHWTSVRFGVVSAPASRADRSLRQLHSPQRLGPRRDAALVNTARSLPASTRFIESPNATRVYLTPRPFLLSRSLRRGSDGGVTNTPRSLRTSGFSIMGPIGIRPSPSQSGRIPQLTRADNQREERLPFVNHSQIWHHWLQIFGRRPQTPSDLVLNSRKDHKPQPVQFDRTEELVWRRAGNRSTEIIDPESRQEFSNSSAQPPSRSFQKEEAAHTPTSFAQPAVQQITKLDPSVLDRLTDDVIRKVEQRVRIERERRGL